MNNYINLLGKLGLSPKEARLYLISLETGPTSIVKLAQKSGVKRGTIYEFLEEMIEKGLMEIIISGKRRLYRGTDPKNLQKIVDRQKEILDSLVPDLSLLVPDTLEKPKIRFFEGKSGLMAAYYEMLDIPNDSEVVGYTTFEGVYKIFSESAIKSYINRRVVKKIKQKLIIPTDEFMENHISENKNELRETIMVPKKKFPITNEINIYENKVAIFSLGEEKIGVIIDSKQIADTQRAIFNLLWDCLKNK
jgi:HTH-type transcriptional regulator, sugar sensing transcriptional regulator